MRQKTEMQTNVLKRKNMFNALGGLKRANIDFCYPISKWVAKTSQKADKHGECSIPGGTTPPFISPHEELRFQWGFSICKLGSYKSFCIGFLVGCKVKTYLLWAVSSAFL